MEGASWLKRILEAENHSAHELAASLTDSPLKVGLPPFRKSHVALDIAANCGSCRLFWVQCGLVHRR